MSLELFIFDEKRGNPWFLGEMTVFLPGRRCVEANGRSFRPDGPPSGQMDRRFGATARRLGKWTIVSA
jgi:hypothetical protein